VKNASEFTEQEENTLSKEEKVSCCEKKAILISLKNLAEFPWVKDAVGKGNLHLHGWYFNIKSGSLSEFNKTSEKFEEIK